MLKLDDKILSYMEHHQDKWNILFHFIGVPLVTIGIFIPMSWFRFVHSDLPVTLATIFFVATIPYYARLDKRMTVVGTIVFLPTLLVADKVALLPFTQSLSLWFVIFALGWVFQLIGHHYEGKRPALMDGLVHVLHAPILLTAEIHFLLGFRREMRDEMQAQLVDYQARKSSCTTAEARV